MERGQCDDDDENEFSDNEEVCDDEESDDEKSGVCGLCGLWIRALAMDVRQVSGICPKS